MTIKLLRFAVFLLAFILKMILNVLKFNAPQEKPYNGPHIKLCTEIYDSMIASFVSVMSLFWITF